MNLGEQTQFTARVSSDDFSGPVELSLGGVPNSWDVRFSPSNSFDLSAGQSVDVRVTVSVPTNAEATNANISFEVSGDLGDRSANASLSVANQVIMSFRRGSGSGDHGIGGTLNLRQGAKLVIVNDDSINHEVHAKVHQNGPMGPGGSYTLSYPRSTNDEVYCHTHGRGTGLIRVNVQ